MTLKARNYSPAVTQGAKWTTDDIENLTVDVDASDVDIADSGSLIAAENAEGALQENRGLIDDNTNHTTSTGEDHLYINQDVTTNSSPTFDGTNFTGIPNSALDETYLLADGSVSLTGDLDVSGYDITADNIYVASGGYIGVNGGEGFTFSDTDALITANSAFKIDSNEVGADFEIKNNTNQASLEIISDQRAAILRIRADYDQVGTGATSDEWGYITFFRGENQKATIMNDWANDYLIFEVGPGKYITFNYDGDVGIGNQDFNYKLEVTGTAGLKDTETITGSVTDDYSSSLTLYPSYTANDASSFTITRHNYMNIINLTASNTGAGSLTVSDACLFRFNEDLGTHQATTNTDKTGNTVGGSIKVNINGTLYHIALYADS
jgi:hypothetical protein